MQVGFVEEGGGGWGGRGSGQGLGLGGLLGLWLGLLGLGLLKPGIGERAWIELFELGLCLWDVAFALLNENVFVRLLLDGLLLLLFWWARMRRRR